MSKSSPHGISLHVTITVAPSDVDAFLAALKPCYEAVTAELECTYFEVYHNPANPGELRFVENWSQSKEWFVEKQLTKEYYKPYVAATEPMWVKPRQLTFYDRLPAQAWTKSKQTNFE